MTASHRLFVFYGGKINTGVESQYLSNFCTKSLLFPVNRSVDKVSSTLLSSASLTITYYLSSRGESRRLGRAFAVVSPDSYMIHRLRRFRIGSYSSH